jgi:phosphoglycolate phosphatase-like HAD superfamily hydrolase
MIRAIAFDFDGVLAESVDVKTCAYIRLFEEYGQDVISKVVDYHMKNGGVSRFVKLRTIYDKILKKPLSEDKFKLLSEQFSNLVVDKVVAAPWVAGAKDFLIRNQNQYFFVIISGTPEDELREIVRRREMSHFFNSVKGAPKDKVSLLKEVMIEYHLKSEEVAFIGDAETDWCAARETEVPFILRCTSNKENSIPDYTGPRLFSLNELDSNLRKLIKL